MFKKEDERFTTDYQIHLLRRILKNLKKCLDLKPEDPVRSRLLKKVLRFSVSLVNSISKF